MLAQRLNEIITLLGASTSDLAGFAGCTASNISRIRSGARIPRHGGIAAERLINGLYLLADDRGQLPALCTLTGCPGQPEALRSFLAAWLFEGEPPARPQTRKRPAQDEAHTFGARLHAVMNLAEFSNVRFGRLIHMDASYISRLRNGLRSVRSDPRAVDAICTVLLERLAAQDRLGALSELTGIPEDVLAGEVQGVAAFRDWICDVPDDPATRLDVLLGQIDSFSLPAPDVEAAPPAVWTAKPTYLGASGLREAVLRFFDTAAQGGEMWLYSDRSMEWMTEDPVFLAQWKQGMLACIRSGVRIRIIHSLDRALDELLTAIQSWLPLYMSGCIEPYYCRRERSSRFSHTLFLCPGRQCIMGWETSGSRDGLYHFYTDEEMLGHCQTLYTSILSQSQPLMRIRGPYPTQLPITSGSLTMLGGQLSFATMPETLLHRVLARAGDCDRQKILSMHAAHSRSLYERLHSGYVHECIPLSQDEALFGGTCRMDLPGLSLCYTPEEYAAHLRAVLMLSDAYPTYRFYPIPEAPFPNTQILLSEKTVAVSRRQPPEITFLIEHPVLWEAFRSYLSYLEAQYLLDKPALQKMIQRYL